MGKQPLIINILGEYGQGKQLSLNSLKLNLMVAEKIPGQIILLKF